MTTCGAASCSRDGRLFFQHRHRLVEADHPSAVRQLVQLVFERGGAKVDRRRGPTADAVIHEHDDRWTQSSSPPVGRPADDLERSSSGSADHPRHGSQRLARKKDLYHCGMRFSAIVGGAAAAGVGRPGRRRCSPPAECANISTDTSPFVSDNGTTRRRRDLVDDEMRRRRQPQHRRRRRSAPTTTTQAPTTTAAPSPPLIPAEQRQAIAVKVVNGGAPAGAATSMSAALRSAGFAPHAVATARRPVPATRVLYAAGRELEALTANATVGAAPANLVPATSDDPNWAAFGDKLAVLVVLGPS